MFVMFTIFPNQTEKLKSEALDQSEQIVFRNIILQEINRNNAGRAGNITNMTTDEIKKVKVEERPSGVVRRLISVSDKLSFTPKYDISRNKNNLQKDVHRGGRT